MTRIVLPVGAAAVSVALLFGAAWLGARPSREALVLPVAATFRAVGVAAVPAVPSSACIDVVSHRAVAVHYPARHQAEGRAVRGEVRAQSDVPKGVHRRGVPWVELDKQRTQFTALVRGGTR